MEQILGIVPDQYRTQILVLLALSPYLTRAFHALSKGAGLKGMFSAIWLGTNTPKVTGPVTPPENPNQLKMPLTLLVTCLGLSLCFTGCAWSIGGKHGLAVKPPTIPASKIVAVTVSSIGINVGQNQATQTPEFHIGYKRMTLHTVPTAIGQPINAPPVRVTVGVNKEGMDAGISEGLEVGDAAK